MTPVEGNDRRAIRETYPRDTRRGIGPARYGAISARTRRALKTTPAAGIAG